MHHLSRTHEVVLQRSTFKLFMEAETQSSGRHLFQASPAYGSRRPLGGMTSSRVTSPPMGGASSSNRRRRRMLQAPSQPPLPQISSPTGPPLTQAHAPHAGTNTWHPRLLSHPPACSGDSLNNPATSSPSPR
ncbi:hypothetical protein E2C01_087788 [Portunus trituberculatus]|uniref:Uncharacterized protein n=1 Tax=Portunus trituberculatus TaxID=210409 RepID=A0A5B7JKB1_PORTR|nr:hypothetical protein [Portunus trituberculatus]